MLREKRKVTLVTEFKSFLSNSSCTKLMWALCEIDRVRTSIRSILNFSFEYLWTFVAFVAVGKTAWEMEQFLLSEKEHKCIPRHSLNTFIKGTDTSRIISRTQTPWERQVTNRFYRKLFLCALHVSRVSLLTINLRTILLILINYFTKILQTRES